MDTPARRGRSLKYSSIVLALVASALALSASTQTWYTIHLTEASGHTGTLAVPGSSAAAAIAALSVAGLAFAGALALAGRVLRYVLGALGLVLAASIIGSTAAAMSDPIGSGIAVVTKATGIAGNAGVRAVIASADATAWPALALAGGVLLAVAALVVIVTGHLWPGASRRYGALQPSDADKGQSQNALQNTEAAPVLNARDIAIDEWDELSRGDDPTAGGPADDDAGPAGSVD